MATYIATLVEKLEHVAELTIPGNMTEQEARTFLLTQLATTSNGGTIEIKDLKEINKQ